MYFILLFVAINTLSLAVVDWLLPGMTVDGKTLGYLVVGIVIGLLNLLLKPLLRVLALPLIFLTAGLFVLVINVGILYLSQHIVSFLNFPGIALNINDWFTYGLAAILFGVSNYILHKILG